MNEIESIFAEALQEEDFATASFAKMKLRQLLSFENIIQQGDSTTNSQLTEQQAKLLELLKTESLFGIGTSDDEEKGGPVAATRLAVKYIGDILKNPQLNEAISQHIKAPTAAGAMIHQLVSLITGWMGSADVGIGSSSATTITSVLEVLASHKSTMDGSDANGSLGWMAKVIEEALASKGKMRHEGEMRLLDALSQLYVRQVNRESELGNRVGLPSQARIEQRTSEFDSPLFQIVTLLSIHTSIISNTLVATERALSSIVSSTTDDNAGDTDPLILINSMNSVSIIGRYIPHDRLTQIFSHFVVSLFKYIVSLSNCDVTTSLTAPFVLRGAATLIRDHSANFSAFLMQDISSQGVPLARVFEFISSDGLQQLGADTVEAFIDFGAALITQTGSVMSDLILEAKIQKESLNKLCSLYLSPSPFSELILTKLLLPTKPVHADLKSSALLCVAAVISSPLFSRVSSSDDSNSTSDLKLTFTHTVFNQNIFPHKSSLDDTVRRACWHTLCAMLQHPSLKTTAAPSVAAHLTSLSIASYVETNLEIRRSQLLCCDLLLKMPDTAPFHPKLQAERKSGIYSKAQGGASTPAVDSSYAY